MKKFLLSIIIVCSFLLSYCSSDNSEEIAESIPETETPTENGIVLTAELSISSTNLRIYVDNVWHNPVAGTSYPYNHLRYLQPTNVVRIELQNPATNSVNCNVVVKKNGIKKFEQRIYTNPATGLFDFTLDIADLNL